MQLVDAQMGELYHECFKHFDADGSGLLSLSEIKSLAWEIGYFATVEVLQEAVKTVRAGSSAGFSGGFSAGSHG
jgi:hypothetical protein